MLPDFTPIDAGEVARDYLGYAERLRPYVTRHDGLAPPGLAGRAKRLLFEGAQGSLLDVDHGTYPYVTSSNSSAAGIAAGSGVPTRHIDRWLGIIKAYTTRVGGGPFPTELDNEIGERIRRVGREYGTVTGRPRRCGWFDAVAVRHSARVSGSTEVSVMLLDVLSGLETLQVAVAYEDEEGREVVDFPGHLADLERCRPVYETLPGWSEDITGARTWDDLPEAARATSTSSSARSVPVSIVSVGPDRTQTIPRPSAAMAGTTGRSRSRDDGNDLPSKPHRPTPMAGTTESSPAGHRTLDRPGRAGQAGPAGAPARPVAPARRHHHGRQRAMGPGTRPAPDLRPSPGDPERPVGRRGRAAGSASTSSPSIACRSRTGSGPRAS